MQEAFLGPSSATKAVSIVGIIIAANSNCPQNIASPTWRSFIYGSGVGAGSGKDDHGDAEQRPPALWS